MKKFALVLLCMVVAGFIAGCANNSIQFKRDSKFSEVMQNFQLPDNKPKVKRSSGVVIYKDETQNNNKNSNTNSNFGPRDITFDMPIKLK